MNHVDAMIEAAIRNGELDDLPYKGEQVPMHDDSAVPVEHRMAFRVLKNSGFVPPEVQALKDIEALREELKATTDPEAQARLVRSIHEKQAWVGARVERLRG